MRDVSLGSAEALLTSVLNLPTLARAAAVCAAFIFMITTPHPEILHVQLDFQGI